MNTKRVVSSAVDRRQQQVAARPIGTRIFALIGLGMAAPLVLLVLAGVAVSTELSQGARERDRLQATAAAERVSGALAAGLEVVDALATESPWTTDAAGITQLRSAVLSTWLHHHLLYDGYFAFDGAGRWLAGDSAGDFDGLQLVAEARRLGRPGYITVSTSLGTDLVALVPVGDITRPRLVMGAVIAHGSPRLTALLRTGRSSDVVDDGAGGMLLVVRDLPQRVVASVGRGVSSGVDEVLARALSTSTSAAAGVCRDCGDGHEAAWGVAPVPVAQLSVLTWKALAQADAFTRKLAFDAGLATLALFGLATLFAWGATISVTRPLRALQSAAARITRGDMTAEIDSQPGDEVGALGQALETMRIAVRDSQARVERLNAELEQRVGERTQELVTLNAALSAREAERTQLVRKILSAQEDERKRVARELHDEMAQQLVALSIGLDTAAVAAPPATRDALDKLRTLAGASLGEVHRLILDLRPAVLDDLGLQSALEWCADHTLRAKGVTVRCEYSGVEGRLPWEIETAVFRAAQEALTNIARHSHAETVLLQLQIHDGRLTLDVEDDGQGFEPASLPPPRENGRGLGLLGMRERVEVLGGTLAIDSAPEQGTHLHLEVPVPRGAA